jgi:hypothetical protein
VGLLRLITPTFIFGSPGGFRWDPLMTREAGACDQDWNCPSPADPPTAYPNMVCTVDRVGGEVVTFPRLVAVVS